MMKTLASILALVLTAGAVHARQQPTVEPQADQARQRLQEMKDRLALTPEQIESLRPVLAEEMQKLQALRDKYDAGGQDRRTRLKMGRELRDIRSHAEEKMKPILSKRQMQEMKKIREERQQELKNRAGK